MAEAVTAIFTAIADVAVNAVVAAGNAAGLSAGTIHALAHFTANAIIVGGPILASVGLSLAAAPEIPKPGSFHTPYRSGISPRVSAYGRNRLSGPMMLYESVTSRGVAYDVIAFHDGQVEAIETLWLNDDIVTLNGTDNVITGAGNRYAGGRIKMFTRLGLPTETSYSTETGFTAATWTDLGAGVWDSDNRGDGIASLCVLSQSVEQKDMPTIYPNGAPLGAVTARCLRTYDWRVTGNDPEDPDTWSCSFNSIVQLADFLTNENHGMGFSFDERILPSIDEWTTATDICDEAVSLKAGGTEPRYQSHGPFQHTSSPVDVITRLLDACDGWLSHKGDGTFTVKAGAFYEPDVTFTDDHIVDYSVQRFVEDEQAVNVLVVSFTSPNHEFQEVETDPWRNEDDITARGIERVQNISLPWVQNNGQARRLAKRRMSRMGATVRGSITTDLYGIKGLGERYLRLQCSELDVLNDIFVEVVSAEVDLASMRVMFTWVVADENIDAWNPATEEGDGPQTEGRVAPETLTAPTIDDVTPFFESTGTGGEGVRLTVEITGPERVDLTWFVRWRVDGSVSWSEAGYSDIDPDVAVVLVTGFVSGNETLNVQAAYTTGGGGLSPWSTSFDISTSTANVAPGAPTLFSGEPAGSPAQAELTWRNPTSVNFDHARLYRHTSAVFGSATDISGELVGAAGETVIYTDNPGSGTFYYWVTAENVTDVDSLPAGPDTVVIP